MKKLEEAAFIAIAGKLPKGFSATDFYDWNKVSDALAALSPEQRCDVVYADWLICLNSAAGTILLSVRNDLIHHGAVAANYLAELAQNADDASDDKSAEFHVSLHGNWLLVANNGRKITPKNLLGLCRFFIHFGREQAVEINRDTIGKFGIGFKSSYYLATEVLIESWDQHGGFAFRLPISDPAFPESIPERTRLQQLRVALAAAGQPISDETIQPSNLGFCTPEFMKGLPEDLAAVAGKIKPNPQGTLFCFHLHDAGLSDVSRCIRGQAEELYQLCPLFLPNLHRIQIGENKLERRIQSINQDDGLPGFITAEKITLTTVPPEGKHAHSCFWRLKGLAAEDKWQLALHSDSEHKLSVKRVAGDEDSTCVKNGAAYAFFPLNGVSDNNGWLLNLHLHIDLPTELSRRDWNHQRAEDRDRVEEQIRRAAAGLASWLEKHPEIRHADWRLEDIRDSADSPGGGWAQCFWQTLSKETQNRPLLVLIWGGYTTAQARSIRIITRDEVRLAWRQLGEVVPQIKETWPLTESCGARPFGQVELTASDVASLFTELSMHPGITPDLRPALLTAFLSCQSQSISSLQSVLGSLQITLANGGEVAFKDLCAEPAGTELLPIWHETFRRLAVWAENAEWRNSSVFGTPLRAKLTLLSQTRFNPTWGELPQRMSTDQAWADHGETFWQTPRLACPEELRDSALACVRLPDGAGNWLPIAGILLDTDTLADCFAGILQSRPQFPIRIQTLQKLKLWGLTEAWKENTEKSVQARLPGELAKRLAANDAADSFGIVFDAAFESSFANLDNGWKRLVEEAQKRAIRLFIEARQSEGNLAGKTCTSRSVPAEIRAALLLLPGHIVAPAWLTEKAWDRISRLGLHVYCKFKFLSERDCRNQAQKAEFAKRILEDYHHWKDLETPTNACAGLQLLASAESSLSQRRDWVAGISSQRRPQLRTLIVTPPPASAQSPEEALAAELLAKAEWRHAGNLPEKLRNIPAIAEACLDTGCLRKEVSSTHISAMDISRVPPAANQWPLLAMLEARNPSDLSQKYNLFESLSPIKIVWRQDDQTVATLTDAPYVLDGDKLVFAQAPDPEEEQPYSALFEAYRQVAVLPPEISADERAGLSMTEIVRKHRDTISKVLVEEKVRKFGYGEETILRELLQNAESAYASKVEDQLPVEPWFEFIVARVPDENIFRVAVRHEGRPFNHPDKHGNMRPDVDRIIKEGGPEQNTEDEVGRFNRGFKSVFCAARGKLVHIRSGGYDFKIEDLMRRIPHNVVRNLNDNDPATTFTFEVTKADALQILGFDSPPTANCSFPLLNASSLVFLRYISRVTIKFEQHEWTWRTTPGKKDGWQDVVIHPNGGQLPDHFQVYHAPRTQHGSRFAAALRTGNDGLPRELDASWRCLRLTFETDEKFGLDVLVNGQFEAEFGRRALIKVPESGLVDQALDTVIDKCHQDLAGSITTKERWLAWARCLDLKSRMRGLAEKTANSERIAEKVFQLFSQNIPHRVARVAAETLTFPSGLMRRLAQNGYCDRWGIGMADWIDADIAKELPDARRDEFGLDDWLRIERMPRQRLEAIQNAMETRQFRMMADEFSAEVAKAKQQLQQQLRPSRQLQVEQWDVVDLYQRWQEDNEKADNRLIDEYTLEGANWELLFPGDNAPQEKRTALLQTRLQPPLTDDSKLTWYRLLGLACLMSGAGHGRIQSLRRFWRDELERPDRNFWETTAKGNFSEVTKKLFGEVALGQVNANAQGEWADYWRRIFYDVRKVHELIHNQQFAETVLELLGDPARAASMPQFLRDGRLPGQQPWAGVLGQSAGAPLFFLTREFSRLGIAKSDELKRLSFFVCTPVRRAAERIGWLKPGSSEQYDFISLARMSEALYERILKETENDLEMREVMLNLYDIPLLHLGLKG